MKINQVPIFKQNVRKQKRRHYNMDKLKHVVKLIVDDDIDELKRKHKLGALRGTHPTVWHVHVDRQYDTGFYVITI